MTAAAEMMKRQLRRLGAPGLLGIAALLLAAPLAWQGLRWDHEAARLKAESEALRSRLLAQARAAGESDGRNGPVLTPQQWQLTLPAAAERQQRLADLLEMALRLGLNSARTEHRLSRDAVSGLERLRVTMPVAGGYGPLRQYIGSALAHDPALSLDSLKLRRVSPNAAELEAELVWSLHSRSAAGAAP